MHGIMSISKTADIVLTTARLVLRPPRPDDAADLHAVFGDSETMRYWSTVPDTDLATTQERLARIIVSGPDRVAYFVIEKDGRSIGTVGAHHANEVGFILHRDYHRQGLMREAMGAIIPYLFNVIDKDRLTTDVDPDNTASVRLLESLGFTETGRAQNTYCIADVWTHSVYFALTRPD